MKRRLFYILITALLLPITMEAKRERGYKSVSPAGLTYVVDSIDYRKDVTRLYGRLLGAPHTSNRIDKITLNHGNQSISCSDIDGIDFNRYFQWEENGSINTEFDFGPMKAVEQFDVVFKTPKGEYIIKTVKK